jgi:hypothetical protein
MRLFQLAYVCRTYGGLTQFDAGYLAFLDETGETLDFNSTVHMKALLVWLRSWGCRQFGVAYDGLAAESIFRWAKQWESKLPDRLATLDRLPDRDIEEAGDAFAHLSRCLASRRTRNDNQYDVQVGPTGSAKILFAARPRAFPPWDDAIRNNLGFDGSRRSYCEYLAEVRTQIKQLCGEAAELGIPAESIPLEVGRPRSTLPKLVDEYNWVTATRGFSPPEPSEIAKWHRWSGQPVHRADESA